MNVNIGDWVVLKSYIGPGLEKGSIVRLTSGLFNYLEENEYYKWTPKPGNWCLGTRKKDENKESFLFRYDGYPVDYSDIDIEPYIKIKKESKK